MRTIWDAPPKKPTWGTLVTKVVPNNLIISGYPLLEIIEKKSFLEAAHLLVKGELPNQHALQEHIKTAVEAARLKGPSVISSMNEDVSKTFSKCLSCGYDWQGKVQSDLILVKKNLERSVAQELERHPHLKELLREDRDGEQPPIGV